MSTKIPVPDIGDFESVEIIEILVKTGDLININDPIVTLESDKSSVEVPSPFAGKIADIKVKIGDKVSKGSVLVLIDEGEKIENKEKLKKEKTENENKKILKKEENVLPITEKIIKQAESTIVTKVKKDLPKKSFSNGNAGDIDPIETQEWLDSLDAVLRQDGTDRAHYLLKQLTDEAYKEGFNKPSTRITPYINTIPPELETKSPGDQNIERRIRSLIRWNAAAMVVKANKKILSWEVI